MSTEWVVTTAAERITLDAAGKGETTLTVTNPGRRADRAVFDVVLGDGADPAWFTVEDPQRLVKSKASTPYLIKVAVPAGARPGSYEIQGRVFSADEAPEESSVLSPRVLLEVPVPPAPPQKKRPWWIWAVVALVVLVLGTVVWLVLPSGGDEPAEVRPSASPSPSASPPPPAPPGYGVVPSVIGMTLQNAELALANNGFKLGRINYRFAGPRNQTVTAQDLLPNYTVLKGTAIELDVSVPASTEVSFVAPANNAHLPKGSVPRIEWKSNQPWVTRWMVQVFYERCGSTGGCQLTAKPNNTQEAVVRSRVVTDKPVYDLPPTLNYDFATDGLRDSGRIQYTVCPLDYVGGAAPCLNLTLFLDQ